jgi:uncharacterized protein DUF2505
VTEWVNESWLYEASPTATFQMLTRLDHLTDQAGYLGYERFAVRELREREGLFRVSSERRLHEVRRAQNGQALARWTQRWEPPAWDGARRFDGTALIGGPGLTVTGQGELLPAGIRGTRYTMRLAVHARSRLFARQIEREVADALAGILAGEHDFRETWLAGRLNPRQIRVA